MITPDTLHSLARRLVFCLADYNYAYEELSTLLEAEQKALAARDTERLDATVKAQLSLAASIAEMDRERVELTGSIARIAGVDGESLGELLPHLPDAEAQAVGALRAGLRSTAAHATRLQAQVRTLIEDGLAHYDVVLRALAGGDVHGTPYDAPPAAGALVVDRRA